MNLVRYDLIGENSRFIDFLTNFESKTRQKLSFHPQKLIPKFTTFKIDTDMTRIMPLFRGIAILKK